jgi:hypothetical protein
MGSSGETYLREIATDPAARAGETVRARQHRLLTALRPKVALFAELRLDWAAREAAWDALTGFCTGPVRAHLRAADQALYAPAGAGAQTRLLVAALRASGAQRGERIETLARTDEAQAAARLAHGIEALLAAHLAVERDVLLPALAALPGVDLPALAAHFATLLDQGAEVARRTVPAAA